MKDWFGGICFWIADRLLVGSIQKYRTYDLLSQ